MKKLLLLSLVVLAAACGGKDVDNHQVVDIVQNVVAPGKTYNYQAAFAQALSCDPATLVWSITEPGDHTASTCLDGCVTSAGLFTAPHCGSAYVGTTIHVQAFCPSNSLTGSAALAVSQEAVLSLDVIGISQPGTANACYDHTGSCIPNGAVACQDSTACAGSPGTTCQHGYCLASAPPACDTLASTCGTGTKCVLEISVPIGGRIDFYSALDATCGQYIIPPLPATLPPLCSP